MNSDTVLIFIEAACVGMVAGFLIGFTLSCAAVEHLIRRDPARLRARLVGG